MKTKITVCQTVHGYGKQYISDQSFINYQLTFLSTSCETNLIYCSKGPTNPVFARKKIIFIWILRLAIYNSPFLYCC